MRHIGLVLGFAAAVAAIGSGDAAAKGNTAKPPAELLVSVSRGPATGLDGLRAFANEIKPGAGMMISDTMIDSSIAPMIGATSLAGLDRASASYLLYVDGSGVKGLAYVGKIADDTAFTNAVGQAFVVKKNGWAVFGSKPVVDKVSAYALSTLVAQPNVTAPVATAYVPNVMARFKNELAMVRAQVVATPAPSPTIKEFQTRYIDGLISLMGQSDRAVVSLEGSKDAGAVDLAFVPRAGTTFAKFVALQKPADYALFSKLPAVSGAAGLFAARFDAGPYRQDLLNLMGMMGLTNKMLDLYKAVLQASDGTTAGAFAITPGKGMAMTAIVGLSAPKAADAAIARMLKLLASGVTMTTMGTSQTLTAVPDADHDGVAVHGYDTTIDLSKANAAERASAQMVNPTGVMSTKVAIVDKTCVWTLGTDAGAAIGGAIDAVRGKGARAAVPATVAAMFSASQARKDSFAMVIDFGAFSAFAGVPTKMSGQMLMSGGFADGAAHFRMQMPSSLFKQRKP